MEIRRIESPTNQRVIQATKLHKKKGREELGRFIAEGVRLAEMAESYAEVDYVFVTEKCMAGERADTLVKRFLDKEVPVFVVSENILRKVTATDTPQGIAAIVKMRDEAMMSVLGNDGNLACIAVLDGVQDPGNAGTVIRNADAAGCTGVIFLKGSVDPFGDKVVRSSMGSLFTIPVINDVTVCELRDFASEYGIQIFASALDENAAEYFSANLAVPALFVFGNEGSGISSDVLEASDQILYIPMAGHAESLNVSAASAVILFEALKARLK